VCETLSRKAHHKRGLEKWLKVFKMEFKLQYHHKKKKKRLRGILYNENIDDEKVIKIVLMHAIMKYLNV
jgi:hypothetical protein